MNYLGNPAIIPPKLLAKELGIDEETYLDYENNGENIPISVIYDIAHNFRLIFLRF